MDSALVKALLYAAVAGGAIVVGGVVGRAFHVRDRHAREDVLLFLVALGGGALLGAVALVLLPEGLRGLSPVGAAALYVAGAILFMILDVVIARAGGSLAQFLALMLDAIPESLALGAAVALGGGTGALLAVLIAVQNAPEGFNAFLELRAAKWSAARAFGALATVALANLAGAYVGYTWLAGRPHALAIVFLVASGGITYLLFHDIAPQAHREGHWIPTLGATLGFALGILGTLV